jgi:tripartite-type tricarboxylate transporter receptor subunit TctC
MTAIVKSHRARKSLFSYCLILSAAWLIQTPAHAEDWPSKPVKVVVPFAAGGSADRMGRLVAAGLSETFKQQFYVENRPGGGGAIASTAVMRADPDGYTLVIAGSASHITTPAAVANVGYDPVKDFTHIAMIGGESYVLVANPALGVKSLADLMDRAKQGSAPINVGSPGLGTLGQYIVEQLRRAGSMKGLNHIPYRGGAPLATDLLGNHVSVACLPIAVIYQHIANGSLVPLVVSATERVPVLKDVPTFRELGYKDIGGSVWFWLAGPKGLPAAMVDSLSAAVRKIVKAPATQQEFEREALLSMDAGPDGINAYMVERLNYWNKFMEETGLRQK